MATSILTQSRLKEMLSYDPDTGLFRYAKARPRVRVGNVAGHQHKGHGYIQIKLDDRLYLAHRLAWLYVHGDWPTDQLDHIDRDRVNNRIANLREVDNARNAQNCGLQQNNKSGGKDVCWYKRKSRWMVRITIDGERKFLGYFADHNDALTARLNAEKVYHTHSPGD